MGDTTKNFDYSEFDCPCCHKNFTPIMFIKQLQKARDLAGIPFKINSGYRCEKHNKEVGGVVGSAHTKGMASDIATETSKERLIIVKSLLDAGFERIEIMPTWIHCDIDLAKPEGIFLK